MPLDLKSSVNLPKTAFPMKANLPQNEPKMLQRWEEMGVYRRIREARSGAQVYVLHDGPPYANGPIHLGTALNKCLKDFIVKSKNMAGFDAPYIPGWDCHGLPIELKVDEALGRKKLEMDPLDVRKACAEYATKFLNLQRSQFIRLGVLGQWEQPYSTMSPNYEAAILETLFQFMQEGLVYKGLKPVYWCIFDKTALAEAEVEYAEHKSPSVYVKYALQSDPRTIDDALAAQAVDFGKKIYTIIWTTTPWTLPASMAIAFHPDEPYVALDLGQQGIFVVAEKRARGTMNVCFRHDPNAELPVVARFAGSKLEHTYFIHPFLPWPERKILGVTADYVTMDQGTGAVHTAPSHGTDDFYTGQKYKLDQTCNVDESGRLRHGLPEYDGKTVFQANPFIVELLKQRGALLHGGEIAHSYPHCWRCHKPVIFRATEQWFISMDKPYAASAAEQIGLAKQNKDSHSHSEPTLRRRALNEIERVKWDPAWGQERIANMVATRPDWCISRQRVWGVPIAVLFCNPCNQPLNDTAVQRAVVELVRTQGADAWYRTAVEQLAGSAKCAKCGGRDFRKEMDIIDVWFESGSSHAAVLGHDPKLPWPADMYIEGGDQHRGWFQSSLLCAVGTRGAAPYRMTATCGWTLDPQGRAMHKSLGNAVDPTEIIERLGGEIVRLWVASVDFREDVICSEDLMQRVADNYRKIRNTFRYMLGNLHGFDPARDAVPFSEMEALDQYMLLRAADVTQRVRNWYAAFEFHKVYHAVHDFCVVELSSLYIDVLKDRLYTFAARSKARLSAQTALWRIAEALVRLLAPLMSFTSDEIWQYLPVVAGRSASVHLEVFPAAKDLTGDTGSIDVTRLRADWDAIMRVREEVTKTLEQARQEKQIGAALEAEVLLTAAESVYSVLKGRETELRALLIVSGVRVVRAEGGNGAAPVTVQVRKAAGHKCERCWNYSVQVGADSQYPTVCERCAPVLHELEKTAAASNA